MPLFVEGLSFFCLNYTIKAYKKQDIDDGLISLCYNLFMKAYLAILSHPTWDMIFLLFLMAVGFFIGMSIGKQKIVAAILAIYVSLIIFPILPLVVLAKMSTNFEQFKLGVFFVLIAAMCFVILKIMRGANAKGGLWRILFLSFIFATFVFAAFFQIAPKEIITSNTLGLSQLTMDIFVNSPYSKYWTILPIIGIIFL